MNPAGDGFEPLACRVRAMPPEQFGIDVADLYGEGFDQLSNQQQHLTGQLGQDAVGTKCRKQVA